jgi:hypothetical protein
MKNSQESPRSNRAIVAEINQPATPESGARLPKGKIDDLPQQEVSGKLHNGRSLLPVQKVRTAVVDHGAIAKKCRKVQTEGNDVPQFSRGQYKETL